MKKNKPLWIAITAVALVLIVTAATTVVPGLKISQYPLTTAPNGNDLFILADVTVVPNTNRSYKYTTLTNAIITLATNSVRIFAGTNVTVDRTNNGYIISVTNITGGTGGTATASAPLNSIQFNSNSVFAGDSRLMYTNGNVGLGTNDPKFLLSLHNTNITEPSVDIGYDTGAGNTIAVQIRNGTGVTNMTMAVDGTLNSVTIFNSGSITGSSATVSALGVTGGTLGVGKVLTDMGGSGSATWQNPSAPLGYITNAWTTNLAGTPVIGASSLSISNATTNFNFYGLDSNTVARLWEIGQATNGANAYASNLVSNATNNFLAIVTNIANVASTNNVKVTAGTNVVVITNVSGTTITYNINMASLTGTLTGTTNFINLSVQAAKFPTTDYAGVSGVYQNWELIYYKTNESGTITPLAASWQFVVPPDYATNTMQVYMQSTITATNGPNTSNVVWRASFFRATSGDQRDLHTNSFGSTVSGTNDWAASPTNNFRMQSLQIDTSTVALIQANDLAILKLERVNTNDTVVVPSALVNLQLRYVRQ